jgi:hypothetical protein
MFMCESSMCVFVYMLDERLRTQTTNKHAPTEHTHTHMSISTLTKISRKSVSLHARAVRWKVLLICSQASIFLRSIACEQNKRGGAVDRLIRAACSGALGGALVC